MKTNDKIIRRRVRSGFTFIEITMVVLLLGVLMAIMLPVLGRAKDRAKFIKWYAFNRQCANDPACIVNFNMQEGEGTTLNNICAGADVENFKANEYNGTFMKNNGGKSNIQWIKSGGRWSKYGYKYALQFNGADTYVIIPGTQGLDFTPYDEFTVLMWAKFDKLGLGDCPFSKSLWGTEQDAAVQYDIYSNPFAGSFGQGSFDADVFTTCGTWMNTHVDFNKAGWVHLALRYLYTGRDANGEPTGQISVFINGAALGAFANTTNENPDTASATGWKACTGNGLNVPMVLGAAGCYRKYWSPGTYDKNKAGILSNELMLKFFFKGRMDEFLLYKRALSDREIYNHYDSGRE